MTGVHEAPVSETVEWFTPPGLFDRLGLTFDLDPAAPVGGVPWLPAVSFYSKEQDGLAQAWAGRVWLNPPYGPQTPAFVDRMISHADGIMLLAARTETRAFQRALAAADRVTFLRERLHFVRADGFQWRASFGSVLFAFGLESRMALARADLGVSF